MILNLLNTIAIAFSIGTSANNTDFNNEKKARRNENTEYAHQYIYSSTADQEIETTIDGIQYKYYKYLKNSSDQSGGKIYNEEMLIQNTSYVVYKWDSTNSKEQAVLYTILKISNYYNNAMDLTLYGQISRTQSPNTWYGQKYYVVSNQLTNDYLDLTMTNSFYQTINDLENILNNLYVARGSSESHDSDTLKSIDTETFHLAAKDTLNIIIKQDVTEFYKADIGIRPYALLVDGTIIAPPTINTEVVDIPELMFTVLTLPFSFISQAFNLTVFPNTPYQVNFSNLFLTVIAIFILLWIIKHIFK